MTEQQSKDIIHTNKNFEFPTFRPYPGKEDPMRYRIVATALSVGLAALILPASMADTRMQEYSPDFPASGGPSRFGHYEPNNVSDNGMEPMVWRGFDTEDLFLPLSVSGQPEVGQESFEYSIENGEATVTKYSGAHEDLVIPELLGGCPVVAVGDFAFTGCNTLRSVSIPDSVKSIGSYAFYCCGSLESVSLPAGLEKLSDGIFSACDTLRSIQIPQSVTSVGSEAFAGCFSLVSLAFPDTVAYIGSSAFRYCTNLERILLPDGLKELPGWAFGQCSNLKEIQIPAGVTAIGADCFHGCSGLVSVALPSSLTTVEAGTFFGCKNLKSIVLPENVTAIGDNAFNSCSGLAELVFPQKTVSIGELAFTGCENLAEVTFPQSMEVIGTGAFRACSSLVHIDLPEGIKSIPADTFSWCRSLKTLSIPSTVTSIDLTSLGVCPSLTAIYVSEANAHYAAQDGILYESGMTTLIKCPQGKQGCIEIPEGVEVIQTLAFDYCEGMTGILLPNSLREIGAGAFRLCNKLTGISIPENVSVLPSGVFESCSGLASIDVADKNGHFASVDGILFSKDRRQLIAYPPQISNPFYDIPVGVTEIAPLAFDFCPFLKVLNVPDSVIRIGEDAFRSYGMTIRANRGSFAHQYLVEQNIPIVPERIEAYEG